jgi:hypothetical protein
VVKGLWSSRRARKINRVAVFEVDLDHNAPSTLTTIPHAQALGLNGSHAKRKPEDALLARLLCVHLDAWMVDP